MMPVPPHAARIERPSAHHGALLYRHPSDRVPIGARLVAAADECAVITSHGRVLGTLGPGMHVLDPSAMALLAPAVDVMSGSRDLSCEIYLLLTGTFTGISLAGALGSLRDVSGAEIPVWVSGSIAVQIADPERVVTALATLREDPMDGVVFHAVRGLKATLEQLVRRGEIVARTVARESSRMMRAGGASGLGLGEIGLRLVAIEALELGLEPPRPAGNPPGGPGAAELAWVIPGVPHRDLPTGLEVGVTFHGAFVGSPVADHLVQWVIDVIGEQLYAMARDYSGNVLDVPSHAAELSGLLSDRTAARLASAGLQGRVTVTGFELPPHDPAVAELLRRHSGRG